MFVDVGCNIVADKKPVVAGLPFDHIADVDEKEEDTTALSHFMYKTVLEDYGPIEGTVINPLSTLRFRVERKEVAWSELRFEAKAQSNQVYADWVT